MYFINFLQPSGSLFSADWLYNMSMHTGYSISKFVSGFCYNLLYVKFSSMKSEERRARTILNIIHFGTELQVPSKLNLNLSFIFTHPDLILNLIYLEDHYTFSRFKSGSIMPVSAKLIGISLPYFFC